MKIKRFFPILLFLCSSFPVFANELEGDSAGNLNESMARLMMQLAVILIAAKIGGRIFQHFLRMPDVLGELFAGILIGPYALGTLIPFGEKALFAINSPGDFPVSIELYGIATMASILLLFLAGLETDLPTFLKYSFAGSLVGIGGVAFSFISGNLLAVWFGYADSFMSPAALFLGAISTATSVGITARVLGEKGKMQTPEGVTILAGAVIDDVLGIIILAIVVGIAAVSGSGGSVDWSSIARIGVRAFGIWIGVTALGLILAQRLGRLLLWFEKPENIACASLGLALMLAGAFEEFAGLAMIIGAYVMGLSLSRVDFAIELRHRLEPVYHTLVGIFFCVMGMLVDIRAMFAVIGFALIYSLIAVIAKILGGALPALLMRFNMLGALRIGVGMVPRGEVALIIAGIGLSKGIVDTKIFGVSIAMTLVTTIIAPIIMVKIFNDKPGIKENSESEEKIAPVLLELPDSKLAAFLLHEILELFHDEGCYVQQLAHGEPIYQIRKDDIALTLRSDKKHVSLETSNDADREFARLMALEAVATLVSSLDKLRKSDQKSKSLASQLF